MMTAFIEMRSVSKRFGSKEILQDVSFSVREGETVGIFEAGQRSRYFPWKRAW